MRRTLHILLTHLLFSLVMAAPAAMAGLAEDFKAIEKLRKGPFTPNYLQGTKGRGMVNSGSSSGRFLFQAAYRNDEARFFADSYGVYLANLFTTNYYELMGEYVYGDAYGSHEIDHQALIQNSGQAMPKATSMVQNWILEKYYMAQNHNAKLTQFFQLRGIGGGEFEQEYSQYFFNFYIAGLKNGDDLLYLPAYLLLKESPISNSNQLTKARDLISQSYDYFAGRWGKNDSRVKDMYELRNAIHNQLSRDVTTLIDRYVEKYPFYQAERHTYLFTIKKIVLDYYDFRADKIAALAKTLKLGNIEGLAAMAEDRDPEILSELAMAVAELRQNLSTTTDVPWNKKSEAMLLISYTAQFLAKEVSEASKLDVNLLKTLITTIYLEGFMITDNWQYFLEAANTDSPKEILQAIPQIAVDSLSTAMGDKYEKWKTLSENGMNDFIDDVIKASSVSLASFWENKL